MGSKDMTVALHQLPLLTGMGQHHCVCCRYLCPALLCPALLCSRASPLSDLSQLPTIPSHSCLQCSLCAHSLPGSSS